jgi:hypothetical protein
MQEHDDTKCSIKSSGMKGLCVHEVLRDASVTPTCTEVTATASNVTEAVVEAVVLASPAVAAARAVEASDK